MATIGPGAPTGVAPENDPNWLGWSKPISALVPDRSAQIGLTTIGKGIEGAVEVAGQAVESHAQNESESLLKGHVGNLENIGDRLGAGTPNQDPRQPNTPAPDIVKQAGAQAQTLESARANGSVSPTYYYGQVDKMASDLRTRFPMFKDQIDKGIAKGTGIHNTANEYAQSLQRDINSFLTGKDQAKNQALSSIKETIDLGYDDAWKTWQKVQSGEITPAQGMEWVNNARAHKFRFEQEQEAYTRYEHGQKYATDAGKATFSQRMHTIVGEVADDVAQKMGLHSGDELMDAINHPEKHSREEMLRLSNAIAGLEPMVAARIDKEMSQVPSFTVGTDPKNGLPIKSKTDPKTGQPWPTPIQVLKDEYAKMKHDALATIRTQAALVKDGEVGPMVYLNKMDKSIQDGITSNVTKSELGRIIQIYKAAKDAGAPPELLNSLVTEAQKIETPDKVNAMLKTMLLKSTLNPGEVSAAGAKSSYMDKDIKTLWNNNGRDPALMRKFAENVGVILDPKMPDSMKYEKILYHFDPRNANVLSNWVTDNIDPTTGKISETPTRSSMLALMTSNDITKEVRRLDENPKYHGVWDTYKSTTSIMANFLIQPYISSLNGLSARDGDRVTYSDKEHQFVYHPVEVPEGQKALRRAGFRADLINDPAKTLIDRINTIIPRMADIAKAEGKDPDAYILSTLQGMGYELNDKTARSFPEHMVKALMATKAAEKAAYDKGVQKIKDMMNPAKERP